MMLIAIVTTNRGVFIYDSNKNKEQLTEVIVSKHRLDAICNIKISTPWSQKKCVPVIEGAL